MRVGIISPNLILNSAEWNAMAEDESRSWGFEGLAKKTSILVDKVYLTQDLDITCNIIESVGAGESNYLSQTLRYLREKDFVLDVQNLGYRSGEEFVQRNLRGVAVSIQTELMAVGNPGIEPDDEEWSIGQPELNDFVWHNGWSPRADRARETGLAAAEQQRAYESLLLRRNAALLSNAGVQDAVVLGSLYRSPEGATNKTELWKVVISEMPLLDERTPWDDVLAYRGDDHTQHLARNLRMWIRKSLSNEWSEDDVRDEIRELVYQYEKHMQLAHLKANKGPLEFLLTGLAEFAEDLVKLRFSRLGTVASIVRERRVQLLEEEAKAPGREIALFTDLKTRFPQ